ncbi:MAG: type II toxin-antitoxin system HicB family antitoxin [Nitrospirae bacterium]|nr:type II toxin-antitoxin system HicB family antitoxin [Nitrospirota bacterium]
MLRSFLVVITKEDNFYIARCPILGVTTQGETLDESQANIKEAIELYIESFGIDELANESSKLYWTTVEIANV